mmetsp:Transcript_3400/g.9565  ORF Transcript_3400/g.9565 Transcript_3400/m.9565 type:complete len:380 (+) Transcript_3400:941-2080(+)
MDQERETQTVRPVASSARESAATNRALSPCHSLPGETASSLSRSARSSAENWCATLRTYAAAHGLLQLRANAFPNLFAGRRGRAAAAAAVQPGESRTGEAARTAAFGRPGLRYSPSFCPRECSVSASRRIPSGKRVALCVHRPCRSTWCAASAAQSESTSTYEDDRTPSPSPRTGVGPRSERVWSRPCGWGYHGHTGGMGHTGGKEHTGGRHGTHVVKAVRLEGARERRGLRVDVGGRQPLGAVARPPFDGAERPGRPASNGARVDCLARRSWGVRCEEEEEPAQIAPSGSSVAATGAIARYVRPCRAEKRRQIRRRAHASQIPTASAIRSSVSAAQDTYGHHGHRLEASAASFTAPAAAAHPTAPATRASAACCESAA